MGKWDRLPLQFDFIASCSTKRRQSPAGRETLPLPLPPIAPASPSPTNNPPRRPSTSSPRPSSRARRRSPPSNGRTDAGMSPCILPMRPTRRWCGSSSPMPPARMSPRRLPSTPSRRKTGSRPAWRISCRCRRDALSCMARTTARASHQQARHRDRGGAGLRHRSPRHHARLPASCSITSSNSTSRSACSISGPAAACWRLRRPRRANARCWPATSMRRQ